MSTKSSSFISAGIAAPRKPAGPGRGPQAAPAGRVTAPGTPSGGQLAAAWLTGLSTISGGSRMAAAQSRKDATAREGRLRMTALLGSSTRGALRPAGAGRQAARRSRGAGDGDRTAPVNPGGSGSSGGSPTHRALDRRPVAPAPPGPDSASDPRATPSSGQRRDDRRRAWSEATGPPAAIVDPRNWPGL